MRSDLALLTEESWRNFKEELSQQEQQLQQEFEERLSQLEQSVYVKNSKSDSMLRNRNSRVCSRAAFSSRKNATCLHQHFITSRSTKLSRCDGPTSWNVYKTQFEVITKASGWTSSKKRAPLQHCSVAQWQCSSDLTCGEEP